MDLGQFRGALFDAISKAGSTDDPAFSLAPLGYPNMKFSILALGAAVAGISGQCAAQLQIEPSYPRGPEARLVSQQEPVGSALPEQDMPYFAPNPPQAEINDDTLGQSSLDGNSAVDNSADIAADQPLPNDNTPAGQPVRKTVAAGAPLHVLAMTPEVGMVPVCWQTAGGCPTPNPVAQYMMQSWCSNGLWDSYACQRARQCAHIQQQMFGHNRYTCGGCAACGNQPSVGYAAGARCTTCAPAPSQCAQNKSTAPIAPTKAAEPVAQSLMASAAQPQSPLIGDLQAGLPVIDLNQVPFGTVPPTGYGQPTAQLTTTPAGERLPNGQPLLQLPSDLPTVPEDAVVPAMPPLPSVLPALPVPAANPVVASRPSASLR